MVRLLLALVLGLVGGAVTTATAQAAPAPVVPAPAGGVTADRLPTVQIDGVVWSQAVVGTTVYAGGSFTNARPAGAAPGTNLTRRNNLLAYDITTGNLVTTFVPDLDAQVLSVAASPDGTRIYVVGDFGVANGQARRRVAAYSTATGQLITSFNPAGVSSQARAVVATNDAVYVGGGFQSVGTGQARRNLAAFRASDGGLLPWNPDADYTVWALGVTGDGASVFAGGSFQNVGGQAAYGLAKIGGSSGALDPTWRPSVRNAGTDAGITSLRVQGASVYGTTWHFGPGGNLEGTFKVPVASSDVEWVTDCHGDNYSSWIQAGVVYTAGHAHYCGNVGGGFPEYPTRRYQHSQAWVDSGPTGEILNNAQSNYFNWHGLEPAPSMVSWLPEMGIGSYTKQYQAGWSVTGTDDYVAYGGEFPSVNGVGQQGLVRFGRRPLAPAKEGPRFPNNTVAPRLVPTSTTALRVTWPTGYDRDNDVLTYKVVRVGTSTPRLTTSARSNRWTLPALGFVDTGLTPGTAYSYRLEVSDPDGNTVSGATTSVTMPTTFTSATRYAQTVRGNGARIYWPLNETSGTTVLDRAAAPGSPAQLGVTDGVAGSVTWGASGAIAGDAAVTLSDADTSRIYAEGTETAPDTFSVQGWIRTTTTRGGRILGFGDLQTGTSLHRDRQVYMDNNGRLLFGVKAPNASLRTVTSLLPYNDGQWHLVTATMGPAGMALHVDGAAVGQRSDTTQGEAYLGYWRVGGDNLDGWPSKPTTRNFTGSVDEVAVYPTALSSAQVLAQYQARNGAPVNQPPTASFTSTTSGLKVSLDASASADADGSVTGYAWSFGDQTSGTGATTSHTYAAAGTYPVTLTVVDDGGASATSTRSIVVSGVAASDAFDRTVSGGWGSADVGGPWSPASNGSLSVDQGEGRVLLAAGTGPTVTLNGVSARDVDVTTSLSLDKPGTGAGLYASVLTRRVGTSDYRAKIRFIGADATLYLVRTVNGAETVLSSQALTGLVVSPGNALNVRLAVSGAGTTTLQSKVWPSGTTEPAAWTSTSTDSTAALQNPGAVGIGTYLSGGATNAPIVLQVLDFQVR